MNEAAVIEIGREAVLVILTTSGPVLMTGLGVGLIIALFQALTTIQEMTLTFVPKIVVILASTIIFLPFMINNVTGFARSLFDKMVALG